MSEQPGLFDATPAPPKIEIRFNGDTYSPPVDNVRLTGQLKRVFDVMKSGEWRTLDEIFNLIGDPHASISAQLRHLRKDRFGAHTVDKRARGDRSLGLFEYRLTVNPATARSLEKKLEAPA